MSTKKMVSLRLTEDQIKKLEALAKKRKLNKTQMIEALILEAHAKIELEGN
jgi:hypothetical protein